MQSVPLVFILGLVILAVIDKARVRNRLSLVLLDEARSLFLHATLCWVPRRCAATL